MLRRSNAVLAICLLTACGGPQKPVTGPAPTAEKTSTTVVNDADRKTLAQLFRGKFAGVDVEEQGPDGVRLKIRDVGSRDPANYEQTGNAGPLYIVDGIEHQAPDGIFRIDPTVVDKIEIQKVSSLYGLKGMNGVVKITTKRK
jgi:outer membrane receptor protein involved in Fe transport